MRPASVLLLAFALAMLTAFVRADTNAPQSSPPPTNDRFIGKLSSDLAPTATLGVEQPMTRATEAERAALPSPVDPADEVFVGSLRIWSKAGLRLAFVRPGTGPKFVYADTNSNETFEASERHLLGPDPEQDSQLEGVAVLHHPLAGGRFASYPIRIGIIRGGVGRPDADELRPASSMGMVFAEGVVAIDGRQVAVTYLYDTQKGTVDPESGWLGIDCDGDGKIYRGGTSSEFKFARHEIVVFRVGERYVSTQAVDLGSGVITLRSHPKSSYESIELAVGKSIPDFPFTDLTGRRRSFAEFRGKHVLLDFWATWCGPCVAEIPFLAAAYAKYRGMGFEILGVNSDEDLAAARKLVAERGVDWPQATLQSTTGRLKVHAYPTTILVGPVGTILSMGSGNELRGKNLDVTLQKVLGSK